jgi:hypothetical protein
MEIYYYRILMFIIFNCCSHYKVDRCSANIKLYTYRPVLCFEIGFLRRFPWPCSLRRGFAAASLLGLWVRIPPGIWMSVCCECCVLSGTGFCVGLNTRPKESYRMLFVRTVWLQSPVKEDHNSKSGRSATGYRSISFSFTEHIAYSENTISDTTVRSLRWGYNRVRIQICFKLSRVFSYCSFRAL